MASPVKALQLQLLSAADGNEGLRVVLFFAQLAKFLSHKILTITSLNDDNRTRSNKSVHRKYYLSG